MPNFTRLQKKAMYLSDNLHTNYLQNYTCGGLFSSCFPREGLGEGIMKDVDLIQRTACCLNHYPEATDDKKFFVLQGMYIYVWQQYEGRLKRVFNQTFLTLLADHLAVNSLSEIDDITYTESIDELNNFCNWVFRHKQYAGLDELYNAFPADMQLIIKTPRAQHSMGHSIWDSISNRVCSSLNGLF
jgi:hypothetical protein